MSSTAQDASTIASQPTSKQWAIATDLVKPLEQLSQPARNSTTVQSRPDRNKSQSATQSRDLQELKALKALDNSPIFSRPNASSTAPPIQHDENFAFLFNTDSGESNAPSNSAIGRETQATMEEEEQVFPPLLPQNDLTTAQQLRSAEFQRSGSLIPTTADLYQFEVEETGIFTATLSNLSANADVQLIQDKNGNNRVDAGEIVAWEWEKGQKDESIRHFLQAGNYVLRVLDQDPSPTPINYSVATTFKAAETDDRAFSINVVYQQGVEQFNTQAKAAIERAAKDWENVISHSSFDRPLEFALGIYGTTNTENRFLAYAGPYSYRNTGTTGDPNTSDKLLPVVGVVVLNNLYLNQYNNNPNYLESIVRHEIAHTLGLGIIWDKRGNDLLDQDNGVYRANTYAGQAYGELLGTDENTPIPLDGDGHWAEAAFDQELFTSQAEGIGESTPLSQITIASLRDLGWHVNHGAADAFSLNSNEIA